MAVRQELSLGRKINNDEPAKGAEHGGDDAFNDEDPGPAVQASLALKKRQGVGEDTAEATAENGENPEGAQPLADFVALVPAGDEEGATWEETSLKNTEQSTTDCHGCVGLGETHAD